MIAADTRKRESRTYNEEYSEEVQRVLLNMLLSDPEGFAMCRNIIAEEYFDDRLRPAVRFMLDYADAERRLPAVEQVRAKTGVAVEKFSEGSLHTSYLAKEIEGFCQYKAMEMAVLDGVELLQTGRASEIVERAKAALCISLTGDLGTDYYGDPAARLHAMRDKSAYVPTGWTALDGKLHGGVTRGGLNIFAGGSGSGKSLFLQNLAVNWSMQGKVVLYISLELSEELIALRLDAMISGRGTSEVLRDIPGTVMTIRSRERAEKPGRIYIKRLPEGGTNANTLRAYIKEFQVRTGLKPDALIIDYLDLMYPCNARIDPSDLFVKDKYVSEELRGLMHETDMFGATASQLNRGAVQVEDYDHSHIAGGISKINTADNVFGIFSTLAMKERGLYRLQFLKTRSSSATGQQIELAYDTTTMRITDAVATENTDAPLSKGALRTTLLEAARPAKPQNGLREAASPPNGPADVVERLRRQAGAKG